MEREKIIPNPMPKKLTYLRLFASICGLKNNTSSRTPENPKNTLCKSDVQLKALPYAHQIEKRYKTPVCRP